MLSYLSLHQCSYPLIIWELFYSGHHTSCTSKEKIANKITNSTTNNFLVYECQFSEFTDGCFVIRNQNYLRFLHSFCIFTNNSCKDEGGCILFSGNMEIVQHRVCAYNLDAQNHACFCSTKLTPNSYNKNFFLDCSITNCGSLSYNGPVSLSHGAILVTLSNSSGNYGDCSAGISLYGVTPEPFIITHLNYTTFQNNKANYQIISLKTGYYKMTISNILNNTINKGQGHVYSQTNYTGIYDCRFYNNNGSVLFYRKTGVFGVSNCYIDKISQYNHVLTKSNYNHSNTFILSHFGTYRCMNLFPLVINYDIDNNRTDDIFIIHVDGCQDEGFDFPMPLNSLLLFSLQPAFEQPKD